MHMVAGVAVLAVVKTEQSHGDDTTKTTQSLSDFKNKLASSPSMLSTGSHLFNVIYFFIKSLIDYLKYIYIPALL